MVRAGALAALRAAQPPVSFVARRAAAGWSTAALQMEARGAALQAAAAGAARRLGWPAAAEAVRRSSSGAGELLRRCAARYAAAKAAAAGSLRQSAEGAAWARLLLPRLVRPGAAA